jgi:hypothetical protein
LIVVRFAVQALTGCLINLIFRLIKNGRMQGPRNPFVGAIHELPLQVRRNDACAPKRFSARATKDLPAGRRNAADGYFSSA